LDASVALGAVGSGPGAGGLERLPAPLLLNRGLHLQVTALTQALEVGQGVGQADPEGDDVVDVWSASERAGPTLGVLTPIVGTLPGQISLGSPG